MPETEKIMILFFGVNLKFGHFCSLCCINLQVSQLFVTAKIYRILFQKFQNHIKQIGTS